MKVLGMCFLALLLFLAFPVLSQEYDYHVYESEEDLSEEEELEEDELLAEELEEELEEDELLAEELEEELEEEFEELVEELEEKEPKEDDVPVEKADLSETVKPDTPVAVDIAEEEDDEKDEESAKKFSLSVSNGFAHGLSKERKSFGYNLNLGLSYSLPWNLSFGAGVGLRALYRYGMQTASPPEDGSIPDGSADYGEFDGTPLSLSLSKMIPLFWQIGSKVGFTVVLPFTSSTLWEQHNIYTMLGTNIGLSRTFRIARETTLTPGFGFNYQWTYAKYDFPFDDFQNTPHGFINEHEFGLGINLSLAYKAFTLNVGGGYSISKPYTTDKQRYHYDDFESKIAPQDWSYGINFSASLGYRYKDWNFSAGAQTAAPEFDNGNYVGFDTVPGDPKVKSGTYNYPFKPRYTRIFANIAYTYSF